MVYCCSCILCSAFPGVQAAGAAARAAAAAAILGAICCSFPGVCTVSIGSWRRTGICTRIQQPLYEYNSVVAYDHPSSIMHHAP